jgi:hypothetical protein
VRYTPQGLDLRRETEQLQRVLDQPTFPFLYFETLQVAPARPQEGMVALGAAGVLGAGAGVYCYRGGAWTFLG